MDDGGDVMMVVMTKMLVGIRKDSGEDDGDRGNNIVGQQWWR